MRKKRLIARIMALMMTIICLFGMGVSNVKAADGPHITAQLHDGGIGQLYSASMSFEGVPSICDSVRWSVISGSLPDGLTLGSASGTISGTPTVAGDFPFTIKADAYSGGYSVVNRSIDTSITISAEQPHVAPETDSTSTKTATLCSHDYQWETNIEPTTTTDGEEVLKCAKCGNIIQRQTISHYSTYLQSCLDKVKNAKTGDTVVISDKEWNSYPKALIEAIAARPDLTVKIQFPNEKHLMYELTISPNQTVDTSCDYYGYAKMISMGATAMNK